MQMEYVYPPGKKQHIRPLEKEHHLKSVLGMDNISSQELAKQISSELWFYWFSSESTATS